MSMVGYLQRSSSSTLAIQEEALCEKRGPGREMPEVSGSQCWWSTGNSESSLGAITLTTSSISNQKKSMDLVLRICMEKTHVLCCYRFYSQGHKAYRQCGARHTGLLVTLELITWGVGAIEPWTSVSTSPALGSQFLDLAIDHTQRKQNSLLTGTKFVWR